MSFPELSNKKDFDFHLENIKKLVDATKYLSSIPNFPIDNPDHFYKRVDKAGWWMVTKQIVFSHYIDEYLTILARRSYINLFFIDLLSSYGMNKVSKEGGKDQFIFPGTSLNAALLSNQKEVGFKGIFANDIKPNRRNVLNERLKSLNEAIENKYKLDIEANDEKIDSNKWVIETLERIKKKNEIFNYLMIIDNQGLDIEYKTIKNIREMHNFGDIIITLQVAGIKRNLKQNPDKVKKFFGIKVPAETKKDKLSELYKKQLQKLDFGRIEELNITTQIGFYYTLLFCCRKGVSGDWLEMIKYYRNKRFRSWTDADVKKMWDVAVGKSKTMDPYL